MPELGTWQAEAARRGEQAASSTRFALGYRAASNIGTRLGDQPGDSIEFMDFREYEPGDDPRRIDWNTYARTDRVMVRRHLQETSPDVEILIDSSRSMDLESSVKGRAAIAVAAALSTSALAGGFSPTIQLLGAMPKPLERSRSALAKFPGFTSRADLSALQQARVPGTTRVLISDMLVTEEPNAIMRRLGAGARRCALIHLLSQEDVEAPPQGAYRLIDPETGQEVEAQVDASIAERFAKRAALFQEGVINACRTTASVYAPFIAEQGWHAQPFNLSPLFESGILEVG